MAAMAESTEVLSSWQLVAFIRHLIERSTIGGSHLYIDMPEQHTHTRLEQLREQWRQLPTDERVVEFRSLSTDEAQEIFWELSASDAAALLLEMTGLERRLWMRFLAPDDAADILQELDEEDRTQLLDLCDPVSRSEITALLAYKEDVAGGLMSPRYARVRPEMTANEAISYVRLQAVEQVETIYYIYVLDAEQRLLGAVSLREVFAARSGTLMRDVMHTNVITADEQMDQEELGRLFAQEDLIAVPVVDSENRMKGIVTVDDIVDVVQEEATEDIQKIGGTEALDSPYLKSPIKEMIRKRAGWLMILFVGEMLTASAMGYYEAEVARAVVLAVFLPLIISSGGNAGSQASTLVIRAMALGEVRLGDWWRITQRELVSGLSLGLILGAIGFVRVILWQMVFHSYGEHFMKLAVTVGLSLVLIVAWGSLTGSLLPLILRKMSFDPANASTPFVATMVDVTGLVIYFSVASVFLKGSLL
jgi:magnesium transporter